MKHLRSIAVVLCCAHFAVVACIILQASECTQGCDPLGRIVNSN